MAFWYRLPAWALAGLMSAAAFAQQPPGQAATPDPPSLSNPPPQQGGAGGTAPLFDFFGSKTPYEFWLTGAILIAGLLFLAMAIWILKQTNGEKVEHVTRAVTIILVVIGTMVLVTAGYNNEQIAPAFGLFGTIVGYILGRSQTRSEEKAAAARAADADR